MKLIGLIIKPAGKETEEYNILEVAKMNDKLNVLYERCTVCDDTRDKSVNTCAICTIRAEIKWLEKCQEEKGNCET